MCRGPGDLGGNPVGMFYYSDLCDGQWASMLLLSPRVSVRKNTEGFENASSTEILTEI